MTVERQNGRRLFTHSSASFTFIPPACLFDCEFSHLYRHLSSTICHSPECERATRISAVHLRKPRMAQDQTSNPPNGEAGPKSVGGGPSLPLRRSGRMRKRPSSYDEDAEDQDQSPVASPSPATTRRNPKRKAAADVFDVPDNLLEASLGPWKENEQSEWSSWTELESDPVGLFLFIYPCCWHTHTHLGFLHGHSGPAWCQGSEH